MSYTSVFPSVCVGICSFPSVFLQVSTVFAPGNNQGFALVNRQRTNRIDSGFSVELSTDGTQLSYTNFNSLGQEPHYWQLPSAYQGDKVESVSVMYFIILTSLYVCLPMFYLEVSSPALSSLQMDFFSCKCMLPRPFLSKCT